MVQKLIDRLDGIGSHLEAQTAQLSHLCAAVSDMLDRLDHLSAIERTLDGFTDSGASFRTSQIDQYTMAYLTMLGPLLAVKLHKELGSRPIADLMKATAPLTRDALEELAGYREQQQGRDLISNAMATSGDPWKEAAAADLAAPEPGTDWTDLDS